MISLRALKPLLALGLASTLIACTTAPAPGTPEAPMRSPTLARANTVGSGPQLVSMTPVVDASVPVKKVVKVGLLVPLSGQHAELGRAMQDAATLALFDKYARMSVNQQATRVELLPKDTGDSPEMARKAMAAALKEGAELIIGPVFGDATEAAAPLAAAKNISVLSFSNNRARGMLPGTYLLGFSPYEQADRVVRHALANNKKQIAVFVPRSPLGDEVLAAARNAARAAGIALAGEAQYAPQAVGLEAALAKLIPGNGEGPSFDALLLAESGPTLDTILRALTARGIGAPNVQLLGTGIWDDTALLSRVNLDGAWFASSPPDMTAQFDSRFRSTYDYAPPRIASLAYDAVTLAVALAVSDRPFTGATLTGDAGFAGPANGIFRLRSNGATERGLAVLQVEGSGLRVISPAATGFR